MRAAEAAVSRRWAVLCQTGARRLASYAGQRRHERCQEGAAQAADEYQCLQKPAGKFNRRQQVADIGHAHARELAQKFNAVIIAKPRVAYQDNVAGMTRINPFVDDRGYMINVVIMTKKKKGFHGRVIISA